MPWKQQSVIYKVCFVLSIVWVIICILGGTGIVCSFNLMDVGSAMIDGADLSAFINIFLVLTKVAIAILTVCVMGLGLMVIWSLWLAIKLIQRILKWRRDKLNGTVG